MVVCVDIDLCTGVPLIKTGRRDITNSIIMNLDHLCHNPCFSCVAQIKETLVKKGIKFKTHHEGA